MPSQTARFHFTLSFPGGKKQQRGALEGAWMRKRLLWTKSRRPVVVAALKAVVAAQGIPHVTAPKPVHKMCAKLQLSDLCRV